MSNVYVHFSQISFPTQYSVVSFRLESHSLRFREVIKDFRVPIQKKQGSADQGEKDTGGGDDGFSVHGGHLLWVGNW